MKIINEIQNLSDKELLEHMTEVYNYYTQLCLEHHKRKVIELTEMIMDTSPDAHKDMLFV